MTPSQKGIMGRLSDKASRAFNNKLNSKTERRWRYWNRQEDKWWGKLYDFVKKGTHGGCGVTGKPLDDSDKPV
jgi:RNA polymerase-binding transcription factor DksA